MKDAAKAALGELKRYEQSIPPHILRSWIETCPLDTDDVDDYCRYHADHYVRNLLLAGPAFHALVICWRNGQRSAIHDHQSSGCAFRVLSGTAWETTYERAPNGMIYPESSRQLHEGASCYSQDRDIHQISNLQAEDANLITLHVYSPPLTHMNVYSLSDDSVHSLADPINDHFVMGSGI